MPLMGYRDSGGHFAVRYVPAFGGWRGKPGRVGRIGRTGRRGGGVSGRSTSEQHTSAQFHVSRARDDGRMRESSTGGDGILVENIIFFRNNTSLQKPALYEKQFFILDNTSNVFENELSIGDVQILI